MSERGWKQLLAADGWCHGPGQYPIPAYSEFMPPPRLGHRAYGQNDDLLFAEDDPWGWHVTEYEELLELRPGLVNIGQQLLTSLHHLGCLRPAHGIARGKLQGNPYWPPELAERGAPRHEQYVVLLPLALARSQDDKGRVRWTLFGGSEQGPARAFWKSFYISPREERPAEESLDFFCRLLAAAYNEKAADHKGLRAVGFRILADDADAQSPFGPAPQLPSWTKELQWTAGRPLKGVRYLLTFRPFAALPAPVRKAYLAGDLHLLPFPGSLCFWGAPPYLGLQRELPFAMQIPLLHLIERHEAPHGIRVPQSGWLHEPHPDHPDFEPGRGPLRNTFRRTHRWAKVHRHEDELAVTEHEDKLAHVLFSTAPDDLGLYGKPMARNAQVWTHDCRLLLDGPRASREQLEHAARQLAQGGSFGYRFQYPPMQVGPYQLYWQRPLVGYLSAHGEPRVLEPAPLGYLTAYPVDRPKLAKPIELWPRLLDRPAHVAAVNEFHVERDTHCHRTTNNVRKLLDSSRLLGPQPLERTFARALLTLARHENLEDWLASLPTHATSEAAGRQLADDLALVVAPASNGAAAGPQSLTFAHTARRSFETSYWKTIASLASGKYVNKDNADCAQDQVTQGQLHHQHRDLEALGDYLLAYYQRVVQAHKMADQVWAGELPFRWQTEFDFTWQGGWLANQQGSTYERDLLVMIPGRDRRRAIIMGDHYDTAYMEDHYGYGHGGKGPRLAAAGADDNHSATACMMLAAPLLMAMSRAGQLECDVWLVHLTGEEFPSDCMGARHIAQGLVEKFLEANVPGNKRKKNIGRTRVEGVYVMDMIAHNNDRDRDVFQICPGFGRQSLWLALQAHHATQAWNHGVPQWNRRRAGCRRGQRSADGVTLPAKAIHPQLSGEVRPTCDPRSTLYNTDGQIFSDAGIPVVLFMENYDINRHGYHDSYDTMANIDLDYGSAVAAICIETVARAASNLPAARPKNRKIVKK